MASPWLKSTVMGNNLPSGPFEIMNMNINRIFRLLVLSCSLCPSALKAQDEMPRAARTDMTVGMAEEPHVPKCLFVDPVVDPGDDPEEGRELNIENLLSVLEKYNVKFKKIVLAQALLETGYFSSRVCQVYNNLFGLRHPSDGSYYAFDHWEESVRAYRDDVQYKYKGGDYYAFLDRIGYAEDASYTSKVRRLAMTLY